MTEKEREKGIIISTVGNFGQAVAYICQHFQVPCLMILPTCTRQEKIDFCLKLGK